MDTMDAIYRERMTKFLRAFYLAKYAKNDNIPCEIVPGLFLGSVGAAYNKEVLKSLNITHVLVVANSLEPAFPMDFKYKQIEVLDSLDSNLEQHFEECFAFIDEAKQSGGNVLVHCFAGRSRSVTIVVAYLMKTHHMSMAEAIELVRSKRPQAGPNEGFLSQLQNYERCLRVLASFFVLLDLGILLDSNCPWRRVELSFLVTIVVAYLMKTYHMSMAEAIELVRSKRPQAGPNEGFLSQLQNYERCLRDNHGKAVASPQ